MDNNLVYLEKQEKLVYYQKQVNYNVGVKFNTLDNQGFLLTNAQPWVAVKESGIRDFKIANKRVLTQGLIMQVDEPVIDIVTPNAVTDEEIEDMLKNHLKLKNRLAEMNSQPIVTRILERAKEKNLSQKTINLIQEKQEELEEEQDFAKAINRKMFGEDADDDDE